MRRRSALLCTHVERLAYLKGWRTRALCEGSAGDTAALHCLRRIRLQQFAPALQINACASSTSGWAAAIFAFIQKSKSNRPGAPLAIA